MQSTTSDKWRVGIAVRLLSDQFQTDWQACVVLLFVSNLQRLLLICCYRHQPQLTLLSDALLPSLICYLDCLLLLFPCFSPTRSLCVDSTPFSLPSTAMEDIGPPPAACPHCGHDDPNEFLPMGGAYFCGACGKKLSATLFTTRTTQPAPSQPPPPAVEERKEEFGDEAMMATPTKDGRDGDASKAAGGVSGLFARLTSGKAKRGAGEENKENAAPTGTPVAASGSQISSSSGGSSSSVQTPTKLLPALTPPTSSPLSPSSSSSTALPSPFSASSALASSPMSPAAATTNPTTSAAATPARSTVATTPQRFAAVTPSRPVPTTPSASTSVSSSAAGPTSPSAQSASAASIRAELESQYMRDIQLLNVECEQLHFRLLELTEERNSLQSMLDQSMNEYGAVVEDSVNKRNDYVAHVGILEAELTQLRQQREQEATQLHALKWQTADIRQQLDERNQQLAQLTEQLTAASAEAEDWKGKYEQLRETATAKLKQSGNEYLAIRQREQEKDIALQAMQRELHVVAERERSLAARVKESDERSERERGDRQMVEEELQACRSDLVTYTRELAEVKRQADEYRARMEENGAIAMRYKEQVLEQRERIRREEKERRDGGGGGGGADEQRLRLEVMRVKGELERKENENRELMEMVEGLLAQVEQQKADAHDHNETY